MKLRLAVLSSCACALALVALPALASAGLPQASSTLIVPNKSIGGVALGAKVAQVTNAWGATKCEFQCLYEAPKKGLRTPATASVLLEQKSETAPAKVWLISLNAGFKPSGSESVPDFDTPLAEYKTSKGIGIGSTIAELTRAYPKAKRQSVPGGSPYFMISGGGEIGTIFSTAENRVTNVVVELHPGG
jgi:hypothetical protein